MEPHRLADWTGSRRDPEKKGWEHKMGNAGRRLSAFTAHCVSPTQPSTVETSNLDSWSPSCNLKDSVQCDWWTHPEKLHTVPGGATRISSSCSNGIMIIIGRAFTLNSSTRYTNRLLPSPFIQRRLVIGSRWPFSLVSEYEYDYEDLESSSETVANRKTTSVQGHDDDRRTQHQVPRTRDLGTVPTYLIYANLLQVLFNTWHNHRNTKSHQSIMLADHDRRDDEICLHMFSVQSPMSFSVQVRRRDTTSVHSTVNVQAVPAHVIWQMANGKSYRPVRTIIHALRISP